MFDLRVFEKTVSPEPEQVDRRGKLVAKDFADFIIAGGNFSLLLENANPADFTRDDYYYLKYRDTDILLLVSVYSGGVMCTFGIEVSSNNTNLAQRYSYITYSVPNPGIFRAECFEYDYIFEMYSSSSNRGFAIVKSNTGYLGLSPRSLSGSATNDFCDFADEIDRKFYKFTGISNNILATDASHLLARPIMSVSAGNNYNSTYAFVPDLVIENLMVQAGSLNSMDSKTIYKDSNNRRYYRSFVGQLIYVEGLDD